MTDETIATAVREPEAAGLDAQRRRVEARKAAAPLTYDCPISALRYSFRVANGNDVAHALSLAERPDGTYDNDKYRRALINRLSVEPKITTEYWALLGEDDPKVRGGIIAAFLGPSGLLLGGRDDAKKPSSETAS